jgi:hypothetical protein
MSNLKEIILMDGEQITFNIEGDAYNDSPNPIAKLFGKITKLLGKFIGMSKRVYIVKTNMRMLMVEKAVMFWVIPTDTVVSTLSYSAIDTLGYAQVKAWLVFSSQYFQLALRNGINYRIKYAGSVNELSSVINEMNKSLFGNDKAPVEVAA